MLTQDFFIGFVQKNGKVFYYGFNKFPFISFELYESFKFRCSVYQTKESALDEANRLKRFFFGNDDVKVMLISA